MEIYSVQLQYVDHGARQARNSMRDVPVNPAHSIPDDQLRSPTSLIAVILAMMVFMTACASQSGNHLLAQLDPPITACPDRSIRTCEVTGGNKFKKRYGRCHCARR